MAMTTTCQACRSSFKVRDDMAGKLGKCPRCGETFRVAAHAPSSHAPLRKPPGRPPARGNPMDSTPQVSVHPSSQPLQAPMAQPAPPADDRLATYRSRGRSVPVWIWFALGGVGLAAAVGAAAYSTYGPSDEPVAQRRQRPPEERGPRLNMTPMVVEDSGPKELPTLGPGASLEDVVEFCKWSVVKINVFEYEGQTVPHQVIGSGVIIDPSGLVATNFHVMETAAKADVRFKDNTAFGVEGYVAVKPEHDLCIVKLNGVPDYVRALRIRADDDPRDASEVICIGHPHDFRFVATKGMVNAVVHTRELPEIYQQELGEWLGDMPDNRWIQHDAATHSGNSGGPLLNRQGEIIGITSWGTEELAGGNFAIHARHLRDALRDRFPTVRPLRDFRRQPEPAFARQQVDLGEELVKVLERAAATDWKPENEAQYATICLLAQALTSVRLYVVMGEHLPDAIRAPLNQKVMQVQQTLQKVDWNDERIAAMNRMAAQTDFALQGGACFIGEVKEVYEGKTPMLRINVGGSDKDVLMPVATENVKLLEGEVKPGDRLLIFGMCWDEQPVGDNPAQQERVPVVYNGYVARFEQAP